MLTNYFKPTGSKRKQPNEATESNSKKSKKRNNLVGFDKEETPKRIENMRKHPPAGNWREFTNIKLNFTYLVKDWSYDNKKCREWFLIPFGMIKALEKLYSNKKTYHSYQVLPENVKHEFGLTAEGYEKERMKLVVSHQGNKGIQSFNYIYCTICQKDKIPVFFGNFGYNRR